MYNLLKRLETLFVAASFAEANSMKLFNLSVNNTLAEDALVHNHSRDDQIDKSKKNWKNIWKIKDATISFLIFRLY